ncbi:MAG: polyhydroxyalkanoate depolymerase [Hyphomicrobiaceae bacterium]|nr:polyhydroxyalkanoate depolymerase [Hyphomicrobiaceae bacterium]
MLYHWYEIGHAAVKPARVAADSYRLFFNNPFNPLTHTPVGRQAAAACEVFERTTRRYAKPTFDIASTKVDGNTVDVHEDVVWQKPFCRMLHFARDVSPERATEDPKVLLVAPMSGHYATLLRGTVETLLPDHEVYITDWIDPREVPLVAGRFDLDDYIDYVREMLHHLAGDVHVFAVCQPSVPVLAAIARMEAEDDPCIPHSVILAGGPVDTRISPTQVNQLAEERGTNWFRNNVITTVPWPAIGYGRAVYPGFLQLTGFMTMNLDRHLTAHKDLFLHLVHGDGDSAEKHREFYDEYLAVMDLTAEFYLQTIDTVFVRHALPKGEMRHRGQPVEMSRIRRVAMMTIEGEKDDITGLGQCRAALDLASNVPADMKLHYECPGVGHYGIFNGSRFRGDIAPRITQFIRMHDDRANRIPEIAAVGRQKAAARAEKLAAASNQPQSGPFRLVTLAGHMLIDGLFHMHTGSSGYTGASQPVSRPKSSQSQRR